MAKTGSKCSTIETELAQVKLGGSLAAASASNPEGPYILYKKKVTTVAEWEAAGTTGQIELLADSEVPTGFQATCLDMVIKFTGTAITMATAGGGCAVYENGTITRSLFSMAKANTTSFKTPGSANVAIGTAWPTLATTKGCSIGMVDDTTEASFTAEVATAGQIVTIMSSWLIHPV